MPVALASAALTDQEGRRVKLSDFAGKTLVLNFLFASCPSVCPRETRALSEVQRSLPPGLEPRVRFVSVTVDPDNDTPETLKKFATDHFADLRSWSFVRASGSETSALLREMGALAGNPPAQAAPAGHTTSVYLFDGSGRLKQRYAGSPLDVARLAREIAAVDVWFRSQQRELIEARL
jgi:protein SCO1